MIGSTLCSRQELFRTANEAGNETSGSSLKPKLLSAVRFVSLTDRLAHLGLCLGLGISTTPTMHQGCTAWLNGPPNLVGGCLDVELHMTCTVWITRSLPLNPRSLGCRDDIICSSRRAEGSQKLLPFRPARTRVRWMLCRVVL